MLSDGKVWRRRDLESALLDYPKLSDELRSERFKAGGRRADNRAGWSISMLKQAGAVARHDRTQFVITDFRRQLLRDHPLEISDPVLRAIPAFRDYVPTRSRAAREAGVDDRAIESPDEDPLEQIESGIAKFEIDVVSDLIERLRDQHPDFFEQAVVDLLIAMGYGAAEHRVTRLGRIGDGGVDGVIDQDAPGLSRVYVQAKRYGAGITVQRPELQGFVGALADKGATQGVFVTTSGFSSGAKEYLDKIQSRKVLIDGIRLAELMIRYRVGVQKKILMRSWKWTRTTSSGYHLKRHAADIGLALKYAVNQ